MDDQGSCQYTILSFGLYFGHLENGGETYGLAVDSEQLDVEDQVCVGGNNAASAPSTVAFVGRDDQLGPFAEGKLGNALVPTLNDLSNANSGLEGRTALTAGIKLLSVSGKSSNVVHGNSVSGLREVLCRLQGDALDLYHFDDCCGE